MPSEPCVSCEGSGTDLTTRTVRVAVPRSSRAGQILRVKDKGGWGLRGRGSIRLELQVEPHGRLTRQGDDLEVQLPVTVLQAVLGGEAEVVDPHDYCLAMEEYLLDSQKRKAHGEAARAKVLSYTWERATANLVKRLRQENEDKDDE